MRETQLVSLVQTERRKQYGDTTTRRDVVFTVRSEGTLERHLVALENAVLALIHSEASDDAALVLRRGRPGVPVDRPHARQRVEQLERRLAAWEPVVREALAWRLGWVAGDPATKRLVAFLDSIPADLLPGDE